MKKLIIAVSFAGVLASCSSSEVEKLKSETQELRQQAEEMQQMAAAAQREAEMQRSLAEESRVAAMAEADQLRQELEECKKGK